MEYTLFEIILKNIQIIKALPRNKEEAISSRELAKSTGIPQTTLYRRLEPLLKWNNIVEITIPKPGKGRLEHYYYLKHDFDVLFTKGKIVFSYHK